MTTPETGPEPGRPELTRVAGLPAAYCPLPSERTAELLDRHAELSGALEGAAAPRRRRPLHPRTPPRRRPRPAPRRTGRTPRRTPRRPAGLGRADGCADRRVRGRGGTRRAAPLAGADGRRTGGGRGTGQGGRPGPRRG
ncbi:hypothetical protein IHE61_11405 [Streptomyces sp. GKU 257-1]|nr:hypothetical protein [Streptomyces sp. GKU 257-1]